MREGIKINPFESLKKMSKATVIFASIVLILAALITRVHDIILQMELSIIALVFLNLFFYSLVMDKISELEKMVKKDEEEV